jgi:hypothetical protein
VGALLVACLVLFMGSQLSPSAVTLSTPLAFLLATLVVDAYDLGLPGGDMTDMSGAIAFIALVRVAPWIAVLVVTTSRLLVQLARKPRVMDDRVVESLGRRLLAMAAGLVVYRAVGASAGTIWLGPIGSQYLRLAASSVVFFVADVLLAQVQAGLRIHAPVVSLVGGTVRLQGLNVVAQMSVGVLGVLLYQGMQLWGLAITVMLLLVMRHSMSLLLDIRSGYRATVEALARAIEAQDPSRRGHAERVAARCVVAGRDYGMRGAKLESLSYAALFHDVGLLGTEGHEQGDSGRPRGRSSEVVSEVKFLAGAVPILEILDSGGAMSASQEEDDLVAAYMIATIGASDERLHGGSGDAGDVAESIGVRLYTETRQGADHAIRVAAARPLPPGPLGDPGLPEDMS